MTSSKSGPDVAGGFDFGGGCNVFCSQWGFSTLRNFNSILAALSFVIASCAFADQAETPPVQAVRTVVPAARQELEKQPVFLFCPHKESTAAISLYVIVDKNDPSKALGLGLEELAGKNSKEHTYKGVLAAQKDPATRRNEISRIDAKDFGRSKLEAHDASQLSIGVAETPEGLKLDMDARVSVDDHFHVGGSEQRRSLILQYSRVYQCWQTNALALENNQGRNTVGKFGLTLTGIVFVVGSTSVSRIAAVDEFGAAILLMDR